MGKLDGIRCKKTKNRERVTGTPYTLGRQAEEFGSTRKAERSFSCREIVLGAQKAEKDL